MEKINNGFTITELVLTMSVFAVLLPAIAGMLSSLDSINDRARDMAAVHALVENKVESLRSVSYVGISSGTVSFADELPDTIARPRSATYTVSQADASLKQVDISISYNDRGQTRTLTYRTYIGELGVGQY